MEQRTTSSEVAQLGRLMLDRADELAEQMTARIQAAVPFYTTGVVSTEELTATSRSNVDFIFGSLGGSGPVASPQSRENGRARARTGVPLTAVMAAYRVAARYLWEQLAGTALAGQATSRVILQAATEMWLVLDVYTSEMAGGYQEEVTARALADLGRRTALLHAILGGELDQTSLWEAADILGLPAKGTYVAIAAELSGPGMPTRPDIAARLQREGIISAWGLTHDTETGIVCLPLPRRDLAILKTLLVKTPGGVGISPAYTSLTGSAEALKLARVALRATTAAQPVVSFDEQPMAIAAVSAPEIMARLAELTLCGLAKLPEPERVLLLDTFAAWLSAAGSADAAAKLLFCHPNTVRYRLRKLEEHTGRSLADPAWAAQLTLALHTSRHAPPPVTQPMT